MSIASSARHRGSLQPRWRNLAPMYVQHFIYMFHHFRARLPVRFRQQTSHRFIDNTRRSDLPHIRSAFIGMRLHLRRREHLHTKNIPRVDIVDRHLHTGPLRMRFQFGIEPSFTRPCMLWSHLFNGYFRRIFTSHRFAGRAAQVRFHLRGNQGLSDPGVPGVALSDASGVPAPD